MFVFRSRDLSPQEVNCINLRTFFFVYLALFVTYFNDCDLFRPKFQKYSVRICYGQLLVRAELTHLTHFCTAPQWRFFNELNVFLRVRGVVERDFQHALLLFLKVPPPPPQTFMHAQARGGSFFAQRLHLARFLSAVTISPAPPSFVYLAFLVQSTTQNTTRYINDVIQNILALNSFIKVILQKIYIF